MNTKKYTAEDVTLLAEGFAWFLWSLRTPEQGKDYKVVVREPDPVEKIVIGKVLWFVGFTGRPRWVSFRVEKAPMVQEIIDTSHVPFSKEWYSANEGGVKKPAYLDRLIVDFTDKDEQSREKATDWLNSAIAYFNEMDHAVVDKKGFNSIVERNLMRYLPIDPIRITPEWDMIEEVVELPSDWINSQLCCEDRNDNPIASSVRHLADGENAEVKEITETHKAILRKEHCLRVPFPEEIQTYGELRAYMQEILATRSREEEEYPLYLMKTPEYRFCSGNEARRYHGPKCSTDPIGRLIMLRNHTLREMQESDRHNIIGNR